MPASNRHHHCLEVISIICALFVSFDVVGAQDDGPPKSRPDAAVMKQAEGEEEANAENAEQAAGADPVTSEPEEPIAAGRSEAERIAKLSTYIEADEKRLATLRRQLADPESEFEKAQESFQEFDRQLQAKTDRLETLGDEVATNEAEQLRHEIVVLREAWEEAKEHFELALRERKTLQDQIDVLERKIAGEKEELARLRGDEPAVSAPQETVSPEPQRPVSPVAPPSPKEDPSLLGRMRSLLGEKGETEPPALEGDGVQKEPLPNVDQRPASEAVLKARKETEQTAQSLAEAKETISQVQQRMDELDELIEGERQLLETRQQMLRNAWQRVASLNEELRQTTAEGNRNELPRLTQAIEDAEAVYRTAQDELEQSREAIEQAWARREALEDDLALALAQVRQLEGEARITWVKRLGLETLDWIRRHGLPLLLIVVAFFTLKYLVRILSKRIVGFLSKAGRGQQRERENRAKTLAGVFNNAATASLVIGAFLLVVAEINPNWIGPMIASLAVVGIAVGLGAQDLVRDYFFGFVLLLENQYGVDDVVKLSGIAGLVERVTLRMTVLRDLEGVVHFVPHGQISTVTNMTHGWSRALFDIGVAYKEDVDRVMDVLMRLGRELREDPQFGRLILDDPEMLGVDQFADSAVVVKFFIKTLPLQQWTVRRELNRRIKNTFDELGIEIPFPHRTVYHRQEPDDAALLEHAGSPRQG